MKTFWLKIAALAVVVIGLVILVKLFSGAGSEQKEKSKTFQEIIREDDKRLRADPEVEQPPRTQRPQRLSREEMEKEAMKPPLQRPQFKELSPEDRMQAEKLFEMALAQRKIGRLPGMSYKLMVDYCRQIIAKYPESVYAYQARRMLNDIPKQYREQYKITEEELNPAN